MPPGDGEPLLIGVDGGASEVKAHAALVLADGAPLTLALGPEAASTCYERSAGFEPLPMSEQLFAVERGRVRPSAAELAQGRLWIAGAASAILSVASQAECTRAYVGVCMPGIKSADGRGIVALKNGPRMPAYLAELEAALAEGGLELARPIPALASDGDASALGEECDPHGALRGVANAYEIGGGTGVAEAFKLGGELVSLDALAPHVPKAWQMQSRLGAGFEELVATRGINERYAARSAERVPGDRGEYPETRAKAGDRVAREVLGDTARALAELVFARLEALHRGVPRGARTHLPRAGTLLDRIVVGQRLGQLFADPELAEFLRDPFEAELAAELERSSERALRERYLDGAALRVDLVHASKLRAAPALGAAALAWRARGNARVSRTSA